MNLLDHLHCRSLADMYCMQMITSKMQGHKVSLSATLAYQQSSYTESSVVDVDESVQYSV